MFRFQDRSEAGQLLAGKLKGYEGRFDVVILALTRGGVAVGFELAERLNAPLDVFLIRRLVVAGEKEFVIGALGSGGVSLVDEAAVRSLGIGRSEVERVVERERRDLEREEQMYRKSDQPIELRGQTVVLVDDGAATAGVVRAAVRAVRVREPARVVVAMPVAGLDFCREIRGDVDEVVCMESPESVRSAESWYQAFGRIGDEEVRRLLEGATRFQPVIPA